MPASIFVTHAQLEVLALQGEDVVINEQRGLQTPLDCWIMGEGSQGDHHRSMILDQDGEVVNDSIIHDPDRARTEGWQHGDPNH